MASSSVRTSVGLLPQVQCLYSGCHHHVSTRPITVVFRRSVRSNASFLDQRHQDQKPSHVDHGLNEEAVKRAATLRLEALASASTTDDGLLRRLMALNSVMARYPRASAEVHRLGGLDVLLNIRRNRYRHGTDIDQWARQACTLLGHPDPVKGRGLRVLSLDGGGVRGVLAVNVLERILDLCGHRNVGEIFDVVAGTSIGTLSAALLLFMEKTPGPLAPQFLQLFNSVVRIPLPDSFANMVKYRAKFGNEMVRLLNVYFQDRTLTSTARDYNTPNVVFTASLLGKGRTPHPAPFVFRNYRPSPDMTPRYAGGCNYSLTHACAASSAAPGYFPGVNLSGLPLKDGGLLGNNPLSIALHESRLLWGSDMPIQCIVSLGTGLVPLPRGENEEEFSDTNSLPSDIMSAVGVVDVVQNVVNSACSNQVMEHMVEDMLADENYYRFNPPLPYDYSPFHEDIEEIIKLGQDYVSSNDARIREVVEKLTG